MDRNRRKLVEAELTIFLQVVFKAGFYPGANG